MLSGLFTDLRRRNKKRSYPNFLGSVKQDNFFFVFNYTFLKFNVRILPLSCIDFKYYNQRQTALFPYSFDDLISEKHPVRVVNQVVGSINI